MSDEPAREEPELSEDCDHPEFEVVCVLCGDPADEPPTEGGSLKSDLERIAALTRELAQAREELAALSDARNWPTPDEIAEWFHATYEKLAPLLGWKTNPETAVPWDRLPYKNKRLMRRVCSVVKYKILKELRERALAKSRGGGKA